MMPGEGETVGIIRPSTPVARHGDTPEELSNVALKDLPVHHEEHDVLIDWSGTVGSDEHNDRREQIVSDVALFFPAGSDCLETDLVKLPDRDVYNVVGKPAPWKYGSWEPGIVAKLKAVTG